MAFEEFVRHTTEPAMREKGLPRVEGKEHMVQDGDVMHVPFNATKIEG